jgi:hypothetical protein
MEEQVFDIPLQEISDLSLIIYFPDFFVVIALFVVLEILL